MDSPATSHPLRRDRGRRALRNPRALTPLIAMTLGAAGASAALVVLWEARYASAHRSVLRLVDSVLAGVAVATVLLLACSVRAARRGHRDAAIVLGLAPIVVAVIGLTGVYRAW